MRARGARWWLGTDCRAAPGGARPLRAVGGAAASLGRVRVAQCRASMGGRRRRAIICAPQRSMAARCECVHMARGACHDHGALGSARPCAASTYGELQPWTMFRTSTTSQRPRSAVTPEVLPRPFLDRCPEAHTIINPLLYSMNSRLSAHCSLCVHCVTVRQYVMPPIGWRPHTRNTNFP